MNSRDKSRSSRMPFTGAPPGKHQMPTSAEAMTAMEGRLLGGLDLEKLSDLAEVLFALNNYRIGPIPGFYVAIEVIPDKEWCVGQLCADRAKPLKIFDKRIYKKPETAQRAAERMRAKDLAAMVAAKTVTNPVKKKAAKKAPIRKQPNVSKVTDSAKKKTAARKKKVSKLKGP
jgi:hypothetical protein